MRISGGMLLAVALGGMGPVGVTLPGTVGGVRTTVAGMAGAPDEVCMIDGALDATGAKFDNLGPATAVYRRTGSAGPVTLTFANLAHGTVPAGGPGATFDYFSLGDAQLTFGTATSGSMVFLGGGNTLANAQWVPSFRSYAEGWNAVTRRLFVSFVVVMGGCTVNVAGAFQD